MSNKIGFDTPEDLPDGACGEPTECYSRVCGYFRPVKNWNKGKKEEFKDRKTFRLDNVNRYYDHQMGVEYTTADIVTGGEK